MIEPEQLYEQEKQGGLKWFHWLVVASSLLLTFGAWYTVKSQVDEKVAVRFEHESNQAIEMVRTRMQKYEDALWAGVASIHSQSQGIDYHEWKRFADTLNIEKRYPGINGIGVIYYVPPEKLVQHLATERKLRPNYQIHPPHEQGEYWPITYIEPVDINAAAVGLDMAHEANRFTAAKKARDKGTAQITGPITLVQDSQKTPGFLFYAPFYQEVEHSTLEERREQFVGLVYAPFIMGKLMHGTLYRENRLVNIQIKDGDDLLYDERDTDQQHNSSSPKSMARKLSEQIGRAHV